MVDRSSLLSRRTGFNACLLAITVLFAGCEGCESIDTYIEAAYYSNAAGATLAGPTEATEGDQLTYDVGGQIGKGANCPEQLTLSYSSDTRSDESFAQAAIATKNDLVINNPATVTVGGQCRIKPIRRSLSLTGLTFSDRSSRRVLNVVATLWASPKDGGQITFKNKAQRSFVVKRLVVSQKPVKPGPVTPPPPPPVSGAKPKADLVVRKVPLLAGSAINLDARASTDAEGAIAGYAFEWDASNAGFEQAGTNPLAVVPGPLQVEGQTRQISVTVSDSAGQVDTFSHSLLVRGSSGMNGSFNFASDVVKPDQDVVVTPTASPTAELALLDSDADGQFDDGTLSGPNAAIGNQSFPPFRFSTLGYHLVAVRLENPNVAPDDPGFATQIYRLVNVTSTGTAAAAARAGSRAAKPRTLTVPVSFSRPKILSRGKASIARTGGLRISGLLINGRVRGRIPRQTPAAQKRALSGIGSGTFAASGTGTLTGIGTRTLIGGSLTMLVRARGDKATQVCLRLTAGGPRNGAYRTLGATGKARGYSSAGVLPVLTFDILANKGLNAATFALKKGRAKALPAACRALVKKLPA